MISHDIQQILNGDQQLLTDLFNDISSTPLALRTSTAEKFFNRVFIDNPLDAACTPLLEQLKTIFVREVCQSDRFYCDATHPLRELLNAILSFAPSWYPRDAKPNQQFFEKLTQLVQTAAQLPESPSALTTAISEFVQWNLGEEKRAAMLESRLCESELNHLKLLTAECRVLDLINESLTGRNLPLTFVEHIPRTLKSELQHCAITEGTASPFWGLWQRLLPLLADVFTISSTASDNQQHLYRSVPAIIEELERSARMHIANREQYAGLIDDLNRSLIHAIKKQPAPYAVLEMLQYPAGHSDTRTRATDAILQQAQAIQEGDWFLFVGEDEPIIRCKLALKNIASDQWLFVDRTGRKVMIKSSKDFSLCISAGIAKPLPQTPLDELIAELITALTKQYKNNLAQQQQQLLQAQTREREQQQLQQQQLAAEKKHREEVQAQKEQGIKEENQRRALEFSEQRRFAAEKALAEARALAEEKTARAIEVALAEKNRQEQQAAQDALQLQQQLFAQQQLTALNVGAWVARLDDNGEKQRCKLAVFIASAEKYIFVDNLGRKVAEYHREQLLDAFLSQRVAIINNGDKFEDQLAKVIRSLRKDIS